MRITFLLTQSLESPSGLGRYWPIAKEMARSGHQVSILALHHNLEALKARSFSFQGVRVCYVGQMHVLKKGNQKFYFRSLPLLWISAIATLQLAQKAFQTPSDAYHICKPHPMNGIAGLISKYIQKKHIFLDCDDYETLSNRFSGHWQQRVVEWFETHLPFHTTGITVNTQFMMKWLTSLGYPRERIVYVPNGVDRERFARVNPLEIEFLREALQLHGYKVVLYVGTMSLINHAVDLLLEAFAIVHKTVNQTVLVLVGGGEDYEKLKSMAASLGLRSSTRFVGWVPSDQVPLYYHLADVSVDPVRDDIVAKARSPLKVVESIAAGTPVVTGDIGDRYQYLGEGGAGKLVKPGDAQSLAQGILEILENEKLALLMRRSAETLRERYYWDILARDFMQVYKFVSGEGLYGNK